MHATAVAYDIRNAFASVARYAHSVLRSLLVSFSVAVCLLAITLTHYMAAIHHTRNTQCNSTVSHAED
jgi:hypothetical protein